MRRQGAALASREEEAGTALAPPGLLWAGIELLDFFLQLCDMRNSARVCASTSQAQPNGIFTQSQGYYARPKLTGCPPRRRPFGGVPSFATGWAIATVIDGKTGGRARS